jgi:hypothetical protein
MATLTAAYGRPCQPDTCITVKVFGFKRYRLGSGDA